MAWCNGCQRGQTPKENGLCPICDTDLLRVGEKKVAKPLSNITDFGGGYSDKLVDIIKIDDDVPDFTPIEEPVKKKRTMSEETKQKIKDSIAKKKALKNK